MYSLTINSVKTYFYIIKMKKKVLVCFFGTIPRSIKYTYSSIQKHLINILNEKYDVDIYVFNLNVKKTKVDGVILNNNDTNIIDSNYFEETDQELIDIDIDLLCSKITCKIDKYSDLTTRNAIRQMYSEYRVGLFVEKNKNKYDSVIVCGPDYYLLTNINLEHVDNTIINPIVYTASVNQGGGYTNGFYIGNPHSIIKILKRYEALKDNLPTEKDYEFLLKKSFDDNKVNTDVTDMLFYKIRANKKIASQGIMSKPKYYYKYIKVSKELNGSIVYLKLICYIILFCIAILIVYKLFKNFKLN